MEDYKAQYYNEALLHFGVKGMKWGVRRKRASNYIKEGGKAVYNKFRHPIRSRIAKAELNRHSRLRTIGRRGLHVYSGRELANMNENVKQQNIAMKNKPKTRQKLRKARPGRYVGEAAKLTVNGFMHPIRSSIARQTNMKNNRLRTILRKQVALSSYDMADINKDVKSQNDYARKVKFARNKKKYQKIINKQLRKRKAKEQKKQEKKK